MGMPIRRDPGEFPSTLPHEGTAGRQPSASQEEVPPPSARIQTYWYPDVGLPAFRTMRKYISVI